MPVVPETRTGRRVAVVGSGPAGLAAAQQLNHAGHTVVVFERDEGLGGLLRFGVPDAKLEKWMIDRRVDVLERRGHRVPLRRRRRRRRRRSRSCGASSTPWSSPPARACRATSTIEGHDLAGVARRRWTTSTSATARSRARRAAPPLDVARGRGHHRGRQARRRDRRRRHRHGLRVLGQPRGRGQRRDVRRLPRAARRRPLPRRAVARPPAPHLHDLRARRARPRAPLRHTRSRASSARTAASSPSRAARSPAPRRATCAPVPGHRVHRPRRPRARRDRLHPPRARGPARRARRRARRARQRQGRPPSPSSVDGVFACGDARRGQSLVVTAIAEGRRCARVVERWLAGTAIPA